MTHIETGIDFSQHERREINPSLPLRQIVGYSPDTFEPLYGQPIGRYFPFENSPFALSITPGHPDIDRRIREELINGNGVIADPKQLAADLNISLENVTTIVNILLKKKQVFKGEETVDTIPPLQGTAAYIELTDACNFGCTECATKSNLPGPKEMMTIDQVNEFMLNLVTEATENGLSKVVLKWAGGEPTLPKPLEVIRQAQAFILELNTKFKTIGSLQGQDNQISQVVLTNGSRLYAETVAILATIPDLKVLISIWGLDDLNATTRLPHSPVDEEFENIRAGIRRMHEAQPGSVMINGFLSPETAEDFGNFIEAMWDPTSEHFLGRDPDTGEVWHQKPFPLHVSFQRAQTKAAQSRLDNGGYDSMVRGFRKGMEKIRELIERGIYVPPLSQVFDYLSLAEIRQTCGSGDTYVAVSANGIRPCHEGLYNAKLDRHTLPEGDYSPMELARRFYEPPENKGHIIPLIDGKQLQYPDSVPGILKDILSFHGGGGCPRSARSRDGGFGKVSQVTDQLNAQIIEELLCIEMMRRIAQKNGTTVRPS